MKYKIFIIRNVTGLLVSSHLLLDSLGYRFISSSQLESILNILSFSYLLWIGYHSHSKHIKKRLDKTKEK